MTRNIKQELINMLIEMVDKQDLNTISVKDLTKRCGITRQAFYYHFSGIYDLLGYFYKTESDYILSQHNKESIQEGFIDVMYWGLKYRNIVISTYNSAQRDSVENFMYRVINPYIIDIVKEYSKGMNVSDEQCEFIAKFYTLTINAIYLNWVKSGMQEKPEVLVHNASLLMAGSFKRALLNFEKANN